MEKKIIEGRSHNHRKKTVTYEFVAEIYNALGITKPLTTRVPQFHNRPFLVIHADRSVDAIRTLIKSEEVHALPEHLGSIDQSAQGSVLMRMWLRSW